MDKIALLALGSIYSVDMMPLITDLIVNSRNPRVALEVALNIYELPDLTMGKALSESTTKTNIQFISFNRYEESVTFSYNKVDNEYAWTDNVTGIVVSTKESSYFAKDVLGISQSDFEKNHTRSITKTVISDIVSTTDISLTAWTK